MKKLEAAAMVKAERERILAILETGLLIIQEKSPNGQTSSRVEIKLSIAQLRSIRGY